MNIAELDVLHLSVRTHRGGNLHARGNRKTIGNSPWLTTTATVGANITRSLEAELDTILSKPSTEIAALRELEEDVNRLRKSFSLIISSATGPEAGYKNRVEQWKAVYKKDFRCFEEGSHRRVVFQA